MALLKIGLYLGNGSRTEQIIMLNFEPLIVEKRVHRQLLEFFFQILGFVSKYGNFENRHQKEVRNNTATTSVLHLQANLNVTIEQTVCPEPGGHGQHKHGQPGLSLVPTDHRVSVSHYRIYVFRRHARGLQ